MALVPHFDQYLRFLLRNADAHGAAAAHRIECVLHQMTQHALEPLFMGQHPQSRRGFHFDSLAARPMIGHQSVESRGDVHRCRIGHRGSAGAQL
jgi:hypothetical protein